MGSDTILSYKKPEGGKTAKRRTVALPGVLLNKFFVVVNV